MIKRKIALILTQNSIKFLVFISFIFVLFGISPNAARAAVSASAPSFSTSSVTPEAFTAWKA